MRRDVTAALLILIGCTLISELLSAYLDATSLMLVYMVGVTAVAVRSGMTTAVAFVVGSAVVYDLLFLEPYWTLVKLGRPHYLTFGLMLGVGCLISSLASSLRAKTLEVESKVRRSQARNALANDLAHSTHSAQVQTALQNAIDSVLGRHSALLLKGSGRLEPVGEIGAELTDPDATRTAFAQGREVGPPEGFEAWHIPLIGASGPIGMMVVGPGADERRKRTDIKLLRAFADQAATVLERQQLERSTAKANLEAETERLRSTLLAAISHDFRTPITTVVGSVTTLLEQGKNLDAAKQDALLRGILSEASRVHQLMSNLLDLTQIEGGAVSPRFEWCPIDELVAAVMRPLQSRLSEYQVETVFDPDGLLWCDPRLMEQLIGNLLGNACRYSPPGSTITLAIETTGHAASLTIHDTGPGFPEGREQEMVKKFSRGSSLSGQGTGLGLAICAAIAKLHGGRMEVANRGGAWIQLSMEQPTHLAEPEEALV